MARLQIIEPRRPFRLSELCGRSLRSLSEVREAVERRVFRELGRRPSLVADLVAALD